MLVLEIDSLRFSFDDAWHVGKYDAWNFYRNKFQGICGGVKAVDLIALSPDRTLFLIEAKDYRTHRRTKPSEIDLEVSHKVFDTLAGLLPAKLNAADPSEKNLANAALTALRLKIVLHLEQPAKHSKLFPRAINPSSVQTKLRQALKAIDPHPKVTDMGRGSVPWGVV